MLNELKDLSVKRIERSYDAGKRLFCFKSVPSGGAVKNEGLSFRYSVISLLGLYRAMLEGLKSEVNMQEASENLVGQARKLDNIGDLGLLLWLCSLYCTEYLGRLGAETDLNSALYRYPDAHSAKTTELAWFLTGLSYASMRRPGLLPGLDRVAADAYTLLKENYGGRGIFRHQGTRGLTGALRGRIGAFADQVYPIYAFTRFAQAYGNREALDTAVRCGRTICALQGDLGQWWWHYDASTGKVVGRYPVFSVHQYGMAPMALLALEEAAHLGFDKEINKGLDWIKGDNELAFNMREGALVHRCIYRPEYMRRLEVLASIMRGSPDDCKPNDLKVLRECRPYCFGWLLYAFANRNK